jgi:hypothetical protein
MVLANYIKQDAWFVKRSETAVDPAPAGPLNTSVPARYHAEQIEDQRRLEAGSRRPGGLGWIDRQTGHADERPSTKLR